MDKTPAGGDVMEGHRVLGGVGQVPADVLQPLALLASTWSPRVPMCSS
ncbi:hypothetical protein ACFWMG_10860 [Streptomyces sp. NPDC127074]